MRIRDRIAFAAVACISLLAVQTAAFAKEPIKGAQVTLGKNPGGGAAARTVKTDANGVASFGVQAGGKYDVVVTLPAPPRPGTIKMTTGQEKARSRASATTFTVEIHGTKVGDLQGKVDSLSSQRQKPITFETDGKSEIKVTVSSE